MYVWPYFVFVVFHIIFLRNSIVQCFTPRGLYPAILTPFTATGEINMTAIPLYAKFLNKVGVDGVLVSGTNGEGPNLSVCEKKKLFKAWVKEGKQYGFKVLAQIGGIPIAETVALAKFSTKIKVDALLVLPTLYYRPETPESLVKLMNRVAAVAPSMSLLYYDFPMMSNVELDMPQFFKLASAQIPQFKGIKTPLATAVKVKAINNLRADQTIMIPSAILITSSVALGYDTFTSALISICPDLVLDAIKYTKAENVQMARRAQEKLNRISENISADVGYLPAFKAAAKIATSINFGGPRMPLEKVTVSGERKIRRILRENGVKIAE